MGKSAKLHKRVPKKLRSSGPSPTNPATSNSASSSRTAQAEASKKRSTVKAKTTKTPSAASGKGVLGGADYVSLMMGSRKKAREEAKKLPQDDPMGS